MTTRGIKKKTKDPKHWQILKKFHNTEHMESILKDSRERKLCPTKEQGCDFLLESLVQ